MNHRGGFVARYWPASRVRIQVFAGCRALTQFIFSVD
jgi:hypothetical protein